MVDNPLSRIKRNIPIPKSSFFLFGARGTGKSTWLRHTFTTAKFIDLLDEERFLAYLGHAGLLGDELRTCPPNSWVVIDEVQRLPHLLNEVHRAIETQRLKFVLCGSSARKLRQAGVNLLAGRAILKYCHPFTPTELGRDFDIESILRSGALPLVFSSPSPKETLQAYVQTYLKEEIQAEALVRNLPGFARFLPIAALFHGQTLNVSSLARDAGVARTTVDGYISILEDTLIAFRVLAYQGRLRVREKQHPKLYFIDTGIVRALKKSFGDLVPEERGALFEGWIAQTLRAYHDYSELYDEISYWSPAETKMTEVDFLLQRGKTIIAIEAKSTKVISTPDLKGLRAIVEHKGIKRRIVVYLGKHKRKTDDGIEILPLNSFIKELEAGL